MRSITTVMIGVKLLGPVRYVYIIDAIYLLTNCCRLLLSRQTDLDSSREDVLASE